MAHTKAKGSTRLGRDSESKRLGIKRSSGEKVGIGEILIRQRGTRYYPGKHVKRGSDDTLYALKEGTVSFTNRKRTRFDGSKRTVKVIHVTQA
ncbi:50S ribosomal protein L27 [Candidatus Jorgensenbacteria bacterium RIFCSPLOWO2_01_FULL_45_25b]|uniref:Large ribosomal subunit protein bL27 n=1 Tax=Candidatus Jorgensenbacteria bacterium RIFCSPLOWO2_01_FULL_45_25b TaxID=1798471 RepID=A0A1F6BZY3_9BACT|nr:MAG: 50S ribosomal protein L27 [Candidatus Jorgensenbacteria bacterium RIFCSPLOWO2_01_FULL_45_25b]